MTDLLRVNAAEDMSAMRHIYLIRHGEAEASSASGDSGRRLTPEGREGVARVGAMMASLRLSPSTIWHSPYLRAQETAAIISASLGGAALHESPMLTPESDAGVAALRFGERAESGTVLVSHLPFLPALVCRLLGCSLRLDMPPASLVHLALPAPEDPSMGSYLLGFYPGRATSQWPIVEGPAAPRR